MAPSSRRRLDELVAAGRLSTTAAGGVVDAEPLGGALRVELGTARCARLGWVVHGTGPQLDVRRFGNPLLDDLRRPRGGTAPADAAVWAFGALRRGELWGSTAIPEIRGQALSVATGVRDGPPRSLVRRAHDLRLSRRSTVRGSHGVARASAFRCPSGGSDAHEELGVRRDTAPVMPRGDAGPTRRAGRPGLLGALLLLVVTGTAVLVLSDHGDAGPPQRRLVAEAVHGATSAELMSVEGRLVGRDAVAEPGTRRLPDVAAFHEAGIEALTVAGGRLEVQFLAGSSATQRWRALDVLLRSPVIAGVTDESREEESDPFEPAWSTGVVRTAMAAAVGSQGAVPGVIAMVSTPDHVWAAGAGTADASSGQPMSPALQYRTGSTTKTLTAVLVLRLCVEGRIALDDPVSDHLPGTLPYREPISIRQLLAHTSGLVDAAHFGRRDVVPARDIPRVEDPVLRSEAERALAAQRRGEPVVVPPAVQVAVATTRPLAFRPGSRFTYSNTDYLVLSMLVEKLTDRPLASAMRAGIFDPLGMEDTYLATTTAFRGAHARSYTIQPDGSMLDATDDLAFGASGSGAVVSTVADMTVFFRALLAGRVLPPRWVEEMATPTAGSAMSGVMTAYGLGLTRYATPCGGAVWGHGGAIGGYLSSVYATRDGSTVAVLVENADEGGSLRDELTGELFCVASDDAGG